MVRSRCARRVALALLVSALVAGCGGGTLTDQAAQGDQKGYIAGDGTIERLPGDGRAAPLTLSGQTLAGEPWSMRQIAGHVSVINVWGSWCAPCEAEAPVLVQAHQRLTAAHPQVRFLGIDVGEGPKTGAAAAARWGLKYPSLSDPNRAFGADLQNKADSIPTTLVLDRQGRIAARVTGEITATSTLVGLVEDVLAEHA